MTHNATHEINSVKNSPKSVYENSVFEPVFSAHTSPNNEKEKKENSDGNSQKNSLDIVRESEEIVEQLPVAELILASHASLLLHAICTCLPVLTESNIHSEHTTSPQFNHISDDKNEINRNKSSTENNIISEKNKISVTARGSNSGDVAMTRTYVRTALPRGTWWLPIRVLKGFLVLQGQVRTVRAVCCTSCTYRAAVRTVRAVYCMYLCTLYWVLYTVYCTHCHCTYCSLHIMQTVTAVRSVRTVRSTSCVLYVLCTACAAPCFVDDIVAIFSLLRCTVHAVLTVRALLMLRNTQIVINFS